MHKNRYQNARGNERGADSQSSHRKGKCFYCDKPGYYKAECPLLNDYDSYKRSKSSGNNGSIAFVSSVFEVPFKEQRNTSSKMVSVRTSDKSISPDMNVFMNDRQSVLPTHV